MSKEINKPTNAFIAASWIALLAGVVSYLVGLWNSNLLFTEKEFYFATLVLGLYTAVSIQKSVRDREDGIAVTGLYFGISWVSELIAIVLLVSGLWNSALTASEKGFFGMAFTLSLFAAIAVQKNTRDLNAVNHE